MQDNRILMLGGDLMENKEKALIIVDVQKAFDDKKWGERNNLNAEENISKILQLWREKGWLVIHIQHTSDNPDSVFHPKNEGFAIKEIVEPIDKEVIINKKVNSSFIGTNLEEVLNENEVTTVVITGLTTPHCISTTTRMSGNLGFDTYLISDADSSINPGTSHLSNWTNSNIGLLYVAIKVSPSYEQLFNNPM